MVIYKTLAQRFFVIPQKGLNMGHLYKTVNKPFLKPFLLTVCCHMHSCTQTHTHTHSYTCTHTQAFTHTHSCMFISDVMH